MNLFIHVLNCDYGVVRALLSVASCDCSSKFTLLCPPCGSINVHALVLATHQNAQIRAKDLDIGIKLMLGIETMPRG